MLIEMKYNVPDSGFSEFDAYLMGLLDAGSIKDYGVVIHRSSKRLGRKFTIVDESKEDKIRQRLCEYGGKLTSSKRVNEK